MIKLPAITFEARYSIGFIKHELRKAECVSIISEQYIQVSPRIKLPLIEIDTGERLILTSRKDVELPEGVDGILHDDKGKLTWVRHRLLDSFLAERSHIGCIAQAKKIAASWTGKVHFSVEKVEKGRQSRGGLRPPQLGALHAIGSHWSLETSAATIVMPTGTGKTETMLATLAAYSNQPLLVVVPWDTLRTQTANKFVNFGLLRSIGVLENDVPNPIVGVMKKRPKSISDLSLFEHANVIVATIGSIGTSLSSSVLKHLSSKCKALILDEAHHVAASSWASLKDVFNDVPILQFSATPFRRDKQLVDGKVIFNYSLAAAQRDQYFKPIKFEPVQVNPYLADRSIAITAIKQLRADLDKNLDHLLMARCVSIARAETIAEIYRELAGDLNPVLIHSESDSANRDLDALKNGESRIVICVYMLGEGFDLPQLKIAAIHDMHQSLAILLQFIGRFTRVAGDNIGDATVIANIGDKRVSDALERLYSEDADWNIILSELSSSAAKEHAELVSFLNASKRLDTGKNDTVILAPHLLKPTFSTAFYRAKSFSASRFHKGLPKNFIIQAIWQHDSSPTLYFVTRTESRVRWTNSKEVLDCEWALFVIHHDESLNLLFISSTNHDSLFPDIAEAVAGEAVLIQGESIFRSLGRINRLMFQNIGVKKHGRRNLSFAMYTGADVEEALGLAERSNSIKNNVSGMGWEDGVRVSVGCSVKGRVWSREQGTIPSLLEWCHKVGVKLLDESINIEDIISNVLIPTAIKKLPQGKKILSIEWPAELLGQAEERVLIGTVGKEELVPIYMFELFNAQIINQTLKFYLISNIDTSKYEFELRLDKKVSFKVKQADSNYLTISLGKRICRLDEYFSNYPPLVRFIDLCELDGNLLINPRNPRKLVIDPSRFEAWNWHGTDIKKESYWKDGVGRLDSIQWRVAEEYIKSNYDIVFDDDSAGEAADLICLQEKDAEIYLVMIHCKFSGAQTTGERIKDAVEVCSQAVRSAKWKWRFADLCRHLIGREERLKTISRPTRFLKGNLSKLNEIQRQNRFKPIIANIIIVQPGLSVTKRSEDQDMVLAAAITYLKETIGCDLQIICSQ
ncbi:DEAD/DEAH box helicase [Enterobacter sp. BNK-34]|uniref:DEAD/DEAH box helicase n=1 Tax=Enterobacter sp. BNK-34 TaxID=3376171 RepID=UPI003B43AFB9